LLASGKSSLNTVREFISKEKNAAGFSVQVIANISGKKGDHKGTKIDDVVMQDYRSIEEACPNC